MLLLTLVPAYHASTALQGLFMSSPSIATLCSSREWECEGRRIMQHHGFSEFGHEDGTGRAWDYSTLLRLYSQFWDLSKPLLLEKTPNQYMRTATMLSALSQAALPLRMLDKGVRVLKRAYVLMWRPFCLWQLSSHAHEAGAPTKSDWLEDEIRTLEHLVADHRLLILADEPILVVSYADVLWQPESVVSQLEDFLPCAGRLDADFVPQMGVDIFEGNHWKAVGTVRQYGAQHRASRPATVT